MSVLKPTNLFILSSFVAALTSCDKNDKPSPNSKPNIQSYSATPALLKKLPGFENLELFTMISSEDTLPNFRFGGSADGAGFLKAQGGEGYIMMVNHEDNYAVSKLHLDKNLKPIKGEYVLNSDGDVHYITGNHDEMLRKFVGFNLGSFSIKNKLLLSLKGGEHAWIFHGDVFDVTMKHSKWLAKLGAMGYDSLILLNQLFNFISIHLLKNGRISLSKKIKNSVKKALTYINDFEQTAADIGIANNYQYVICGHIHHPQMRMVHNAKGAITYLNSGDWIENLTALEYHQGQWNIYYHQEMALPDETENEEDELNVNILFNNLIQEFNEMRTP